MDSRSRKTAIQTPLLDATDKAIKAAKHLTDEDAGAVEAMRALARKIDAWDVIVEWALDDAAEREGSRPAVPQNDNVSLASYLKYCDALGLTVVGRTRADVAPKGAAQDGTLGKLRAVHGKGA